MTAGWRIQLQVERACVADLERQQNEDGGSAVSCSWRSGVQTICTSDQSELLRAQPPNPACFCKIRVQLVETRSQLRNDAHTHFILLLPRMIRLVTRSLDVF